MPDKAGGREWTTMDFFWTSFGLLSSSASVAFQKCSNSCIVMIEARDLAWLVAMQHRCCPLSVERQRGVVEWRATETISFFWGRIPADITLAKRKRCVWN